MDVPFILSLAPASAHFFIMKIVGLWAYKKHSRMFDFIGMLRVYRKLIITLVKVETDGVVMCWGTNN